MNMKKRAPQTLREKKFCTWIDLYGKKEAAKAVKKIWFINDNKTAELLAKQLLERLYE